MEYSPRNMAFGTLVSRSKFYKNQKTTELIQILKEVGILDKFYDDHFTPGVIQRTEYINRYLQTKFQENEKMHVLTIGGGFNTYYDDIPHSPKVKWTDTDIDDVTMIRYTHWGESYDPMINHHLVSLDLNALGSMAFLQAMTQRVDVLLAEGVLMYISKQRAKEILELPWKNIVFDVLGSNRKTPLGKNHLWTYKENEWNLNITDSYQFDGKERDSKIYTVTNE